MKMLKLVYGILGEMIQNKVILDKVGMISMVDKMKEVRLKLFKHMNRKCENVPMSRYGRLVVIEIRTSMGRLKKIWEGGGGSSIMIED
ncbi:hypothetical protein H5410_057677 [Solanum commersonii]|uniref:Uncharacterized protein n=1 Tax=Solanum commersonii TaxID=4109 RepID=A0A9J5WQQ1_SOLCO|nr:hypothetical protein H5410_057677 [Solanum commersonii]